MERDFDGHSQVNFRSACLNHMTAKKQEQASVKWPSMRFRMVPALVTEI
jgi:hypothetical protein